MSTPELIDYIKNQLKLGRSEEVIKTMLKNAGWQEADIEEGFRAVSGKPPLAMPPSPQLMSAGFQPVFSDPSGQSELALAGPGALLKNSWQIYKSRFWTLIGLLLFQVIVIAGFLIIPAYFATALGAAAKWFFVIAFIPALLAIIYWVLWSNLALLFAISNHQEFIGIIESYRRAWGKVRPYFVISILASLIMLGGFVLLIVPGIIFIIWFLPAFFVFISEGHKGLNALLRSKEYVSGKWGKVFRRFVVIALISILIYLIVAGITFAVGKIFGDSGILKLITNVISAVVNILYSSFAAIYIFSLYSALRESRPQLVNQPVSGKKGFFIFCAILGVLAPIILIAGLIFAAPVVFQNLIKWGGGGENSLYLDPATQFAQVRDAQRISDLNTLKNAIKIYQETISNKLNCQNGKIFRSTNGTQAVDGSGWLPIDFTKIPGGSPLINLGVDPLNNSEHFYGYTCDSKINTFKLRAIFESEKYLDYAKNDGGDDVNIYEVGANLNPELNFMKKEEFSTIIPKKVPSFVSLVPKTECRIGGSANGMPTWNYSVKSLQGETLFNAGAYMSQDECLFVRSLIEEAVKAKNASPCQKTADATWIENCVEHAAIILENISICDQSIEKDQCYYMYKVLKEGI